MATDTNGTAASADGEAEPAGSAAGQEAAQPGGPRAPSAPPPPLSGPVAAEPTLEQKLAAAQAETARVRDQLLRTAADFDNFRKRSRREGDDARRLGRELTVKELLPIFDNLERAAAHTEGPQDAKALADGLRIVLRQFNDTLDRMGIKRVVTVGRPFDPGQHEAIQHLESTEHPAGVVVAEVQPGYVIGDHLVRAAMVVVSKGPPESADFPAP